jgi:histidyl-tRNA synthetase
MVDTLHLFEAVGIPYQLEPHLPATRDVHAELLFAVSGVDRKGERAIIATGGRLDELMKKQDKAQGHAVGISLELPEVVEPALDDEALLSCFVVHVGEAARLKAFALLDALWRADVSVQEALLAESLRDQMDLAKLQGARYIAIIGQREALDKTVILRNRESGTQVSLPVDKLPERLARK